MSKARSEGKHSDTFVVIPVYNEGSVVGTVIHKVLKYFENVVCVDDGSKDNSTEVIKKTKAHAVRHPINLGAGAATQTGIDFALQNPAIKYFITIDADGQHDIADAVAMLEQLKKEKLDVVFGSRFLGKVENIGSFKKQFLKVATLFSGSTTGVKLSDPHIGLRAFNRKFAENLKITLPGFAHASEVVKRIAEGGYKYSETPVTVTYSDYSKSKGQSMLNAVNITFDLFVNKASKR